MCLGTPSGFGGTGSKCRLLYMPFNYFWTSSSVFCRVLDMSDPWKRVVLSSLAHDTKFGMTEWLIDLSRQGQYLIRKYLTGLDIMASSHQTLQLRDLC